MSVINKAIRCLFFFSVNRFVGRRRCFGKFEMFDETQILQYDFAEKNRFCFRKDVRKYYSAKLLPHLSKTFLYFFLVKPRNPWFARRLAQAARFAVTIDTMILRIGFFRVVSLERRFKRIAGHHRRSFYCNQLTCYRYKFIFTFTVSTRNVVGVLLLVHNARFDYTFCRDRWRTWRLRQIIIVTKSV